MALTAQQKAYLEYLARCGDMNASALIAASQDEESMGVVASDLLVDVAAKVENFYAPTAGCTMYGTAAFAQATTVCTTPRNVYAKFGQSWNGGNIRLTGTDQFGSTQTEDLVPTSPAGIAASTKVFKTVTSIQNLATGTAGYVQVGMYDTLIGLSNRVANTYGSEYLEDGVKFVPTHTVIPSASAFKPVTAPNGSSGVDYQVFYRKLV